MMWKNKALWMICLDLIIFMTVFEKSLIGQHNHYLH